MLALQPSKPPRLSRFSKWSSCFASVARIIFGHRLNPLPPEIATKQNDKAFRGLMRAFPKGGMLSCSKIGCMPKCLKFSSGSGGS
jgi:hypothetical protein